LREEGFFKRHVASVDLTLLARASHQISNKISPAPFNIPSQIQKVTPSDKDVFVQMNLCRKKSIGRTAIVGTPI
jgi:hypothetical protein